MMQHEAEQAIKADKQESSALTRTKQLAKRSAFDLNLAHDAAVSAQLPFVSLSRIKRARREMNDLLRELEINECEHAQLQCSAENCTA
jgi:hypothetical protein